MFEKSHVQFQPPRVQFWVISADIHNIHNEKKQEEKVNVKAAISMFSEISFQMNAICLSQ